MMGRLQSIADKIKIKLAEHSFAKQEIERHLRLLQESKDENIDVCLHFLLKTACEFNLLKETHNLLELNLFKNIDQSLQFDKKEPSRWSSDNGKTLLGLAAFHGHHELVSYLIEVRLANVNSKDMNGDTPLHQVVYGDSYPFTYGSYGTSHDKVAKYLIRHGGDLSVKDHKEKTPYDITKWCSPLKVEDMVGRRFITNTGSAIYYADKVRPVFKKELARQKRDQHFSVIRIGEDRQAKGFDQFCLDHAVEEYVKDKKATFGYSSIEELYEALDSLSEEDWEHMRMVISSQEPAPYSFKFGLISEHLSKIGKQSGFLGLMVTLITYYETQSILLSVTAGSVSAGLAWNYLTETAYNQKVNERAVRNERVSDLQQHDRFFKSPQQFRIQQRQQLSDSNSELDRTPTSASRNFQYKFK